MHELIRLLEQHIDEIGSKNLKIIALVAFFALFGFILTMCASHGS